MKQTVYLSKALRVWIGVFCILIMISIFPLRLFRRTVTVGESSAPRVISQVVNDEHSIRQYFVAQYNKIDSVSVYVSSIEGGRYMAIALQKNGYSSVCSRYIDLQNESLPGYVKVPLGVALEPGETYNFLLTGKLSSYSTARVNHDADTPPGTGTYLFDQESVPGVRLAAYLTYDLPLSKQSSLVLMGAVLVTGAVLSVLVSAFFRKKANLDTLLMTGDVVFYPLAILLTVGYLILFILNFPLRVFDKDPLEISFYAVGILIAGILSVYALYRFTREGRREDDLYGREWLSAALMALAIKYACDYVNGTYNLAHYISARQMMVCLLLMALTFFPIRILLHPAGLILAGVSTICSVLWARANWQVSEDELADLYHLETELTASIAILTVYVIACLVTESIIVKREKKSSAAGGTPYACGRKLPLYLLLSIATACVLIAFRNTRIWIPAMAALYTLIYLCARRTVYTGRWIYIVQSGVCIHFFGSLLYCLLHRGFQNYVFNRYGFVFSTVTVTAQYMTMVCAVVTAALFNRLRAYIADRQGEGVCNYNTGIRGFVRFVWRELMLLGIVTSYMIFTISRLITFVVVCLWVFLLLLQFLAGMKKETVQKSGAARNSRIKRCLRQMLLSAASIVLPVMLIFPAAFALQRTIPSLYADQDLLPAIEEVSGYAFYEDNLKTPPFLLGKAGPDSAAYIRIRRFYHIFSNRIWGAKSIFDWYHFDPNNYDDNHYQEYWINGAELPEEYLREKEEARRIAEGNLEKEAEGTAESSVLPVETEISQEDSSKTLDKATEKSDISNGRFEIYKSYLDNLNMAGHTEMSNENTANAHAHNIYLQVAFDCGIPVGILFLAWIGFTILGALVRYLKNECGKTDAEQKQVSVYMQVLSLSVSFAAAGLFDWNFHLANPCTLIFMTGIAPLVIMDGRKI